jgi:hypothetical protein
MMCECLRFGSERVKQLCIKDDETMSNSNAMRAAAQSIQVCRDQTNCF